MITESVEAPSLNFNTYIDLFISNAKSNPNKTVYIQLDETGNEVGKISFGNLLSNAIIVSQKLLNHTTKSERCLICIPAGLEFIIAFLGCLISGVIAVPTILPKRNKENRRFWSIINDSKPSMIITVEDHFDLIDKQLNSANINCSINSIQTIIISETDNLTSDIHSRLGDDIAFLQYTSGSIKTPNGIKVSQQNLLHNSEIVRQSFNHTKDLVCVSWLPPFHDMGLIGCILQPLYVGGSCVILKPRDFIRNPQIWFEAINKYKATTVGCPNFALDYCVEKISEPNPSSMNLSSLKVLFCGSEPVRENSLKSFSESFECLDFKPNMFLPCYGLAEATLMVTGIPQKEDPHFFNANLLSLEENKIATEAKENEKSISYTSCGITWNNTDVIIVDPKTRINLQENEIGEIWVKNDSICIGYWKNANETDYTFNALTLKNNEGPYLRTGDLGFIHIKNLFITGRLKDLIIIRGSNYYPNDIENIVDKCHPALQLNSCAAFTNNINDNSKLIVVQEIKRVFIRNHNDNEIFQKIISDVSEDLEISIDVIILIDPMSLPKTSSGKIKRLEAKQLYLDNNLKVISSWVKNESKTISNSSDTEQPSSDKITKWIINWLSNKLPLDPDQIDPNQSVMSFGLDSIGAVELETEINNTFNINLFVGDFIENNSIKFLAEEGYKQTKL
jgi:acyl-CoA synthetase (AMP-forming)/AMP-acid ligase II/acyl carrier protein